MNKKIDNIIIKFKQAIKRVLIKHSYLYKVLYHFFALLTNFDGREHWFRRKRGTNVYYVIRPRTNKCVEGLLALYIRVMKRMDYAFSKGYIPIIDMKNYKTQYYNGKENIWEWFFTQPCRASLDEVYGGTDSVLLSGYKLKSQEDEELFSQNVFNNDELNIRSHNLMFNNMQFNCNIENKVAEELRSIPINECIGVYLRGTDYVKMKPVGENVQPTAEMIIKKIHEFRKKHNNPPLYLVTEDKEIYEKIKNAFPDDLYLVSFDSFISNYDGKNFLSKSGVFKKDMRSVGEDYLVKIILLSKCKYLVSSITCGSRVAYAFNGNKYSDQFVFDLGKYK